MFLSCHYGFMNFFNMLNFVFSNMMPRGVSTCKILTFQDKYFQKYKAQNIVKFSSLAFLAIFKFCPRNLWHFEDVAIKYPKQILHYIKFICRRACAKNSSLNFMSLVGFQASKIWMFFWKIYHGASLEIIFRQK